MRRAEKNYCLKNIIYSVISIIASPLLSRYWGKGIVKECDRSDLIHKLNYLLHGSQ